MRTALFVQNLFVLSLSLAGACTLTAPDGKDDAVQRCTTVEDCPDAEDNRFVYSCERSKKTQGEQSKQVCVPRFKSVKCNAQAALGEIDPATPPADGGEAYFQFLLRIAEDLEKNAEKICPDDKLGMFGCPPNAEGQCSEGEVVDVGGVQFCSDPKALTVPAGGSAALATADIRDQYCRWYFCSEDFVCNSGQCVPCDPTAPFERGGCRTMYRDGAISPVQNDLSQDCNMSGEESIASIKPADGVFGSFPPAL